MTPLCRLCLYWKRRSHEYGTCFHESRKEFFPGPKSSTHEHDKCEHFAQRIIGPELPSDSNPVAT